MGRRRRRRGIKISASHSCSFSKREKEREKRKKERRERIKSGLVKSNHPLDHSSVARNLDRIRSIAVHLCTVGKNTIRAGPSVVVPLHGRANTYLVRTFSWFPGRRDNICPRRRPVVYTRHSGINARRGHAFGYTPPLVYTAEEKEDCATPVSLLHLCNLCTYGHSTRR